MYAPYFPKPQTEGFFVIMSNPTKDEIIALKRIGWQVHRHEKGAASSRLSVRAVVKLPESSEDRVLDVAVVSDGYIGMVWRVHGVVVPKPPLVVDDGGKKPLPE